MKTKPLDQILAPLTRKLGLKSPDKVKKEPDLLQESITPDFDIRPDYALVNGVLHRIIKATGYPRKVEDGWLESFLFASEPYDISLHIEPASIVSTLVLLHNEIIKQTADLAASTQHGTPNPSLDIKRADTLKVYESLYKGQEKLFEVSLYVDGQALNLDDLDLLTEKCKANMNAILIIPQTVDYRMAPGIKSMLPHAVDSLYSKRQFTTGALSATFPFLYPVDSAKKGLFFGHERRTQNPIFIDFDAMSNKHFFVLGISGSGKSYTSKFLVMQQLLAQQGKVYILDPNGEYKGLTQKMGGEIIQLSKDSDSIINLFDLAGEDYGSKMLTLISVFDIITGGLTESQKGVLNQALDQVYKKKGIWAHNPSTWTRKPPTFSDLKAVLEVMQKRLRKSRYNQEEKSLEVLVNRVRMYSKNGFFGFLDRETNANLKNDFLDFDLSALPSQVRQLVMFSVLELISRQIKKDNEPKVVLIDEGWSLLRSKEAENYILEFIKTSRKFNASIGFITQEIEDLLRSEGGKSILNTTSTKILLRQNASNLGLISKSLALNEKEEGELLKAGKGQGLLITEKGRFEFQVNAPPKIHQLITTDPNDRNTIVTEQKTDSKTQKIRIDLNRGFYEAQLLSYEEKDALEKEGYVQFKTRLTAHGGASYYYVKTQGNESKDHALLCWFIADEIKKQKGTAKVNASVEADVTAKIGKHSYCFEVETGSILATEGFEKIKEKAQRLSAKFDKVIFVVTDRRLREKYSRITEKTTITRTEVGDTIRKLSR